MHYTVVKVRNQNELKFSNVLWIIQQPKFCLPSLPKCNALIIFFYCWSFFLSVCVITHEPLHLVVVVVVTRSDQPKPPAVAIVRQNGLSSASCRASVAVTPVSRQIWWIPVVGGRPLARLHSCEGRSPSLALVQIRRIWFAGTSLRSLHLAWWNFAWTFKLDNHTNRVEFHGHR